MTRLAFQGALLAANAAEEEPPPPPAGIELHVDDTAQLVQAAQATTFTVPLPANSSTGDRVLLYVASREAGGTAVATHTAPAGWSTAWSSGSQAQRMSCFYRDLDGGEGESADVTVSAANIGCALAVRVTGHESPSDIAASSEGASGFGAAINVPALTPAGGAAEYMWLVIGWGRRGGDRSFSSLPDYTHDAEHLFVDVGSGDGGQFLLIAWRIHETASEDPGSLTMSSAIASWVVRLNAVSPESA